MSNVKSSLWLPNTNITTAFNAYRSKTVVTENIATTLHTIKDVLNSATLQGSQSHVPSVTISIQPLLSLEPHVYAHSSATYGLNNEIYQQ